MEKLGLCKFCGGESYFKIVDAFIYDDPAKVTVLHFDKTKYYTTALIKVKPACKKCNIVAPESYSIKLKIDEFGKPVVVDYNACESAIQYWNNGGSSY